MKSPQPIHALLSWWYSDLTTGFLQNNDSENMGKKLKSRARGYLKWVFYCMLLLDLVYISLLLRLDILAIQLIVACRVKKLTRILVGTSAHINYYS